MTKAPDEKPDLDQVAALFEKHALKAERFSKAETRAGKTPDFRIKRGEVLAAYCEVKSPRDDWLDEQLAAAEPGDIAGGMRDDPILNRLSGHIHKAVAQFEAVNSNRDVPNILVFVNHDDMSDPSDMRETLTGMFHADDGKRYPMSVRVSEGKIREEKRSIDAYMWVDAKTGQLQSVFFSESNEEHKQAVCTMFGLDPSKIER